MTQKRQEIAIGKTRRSTFTHELNDRQIHEHVITTGCRGSENFIKNVKYHKKVYNSIGRSHRSQDINDVRSQKINDTGKTRTPLQFTHEHLDLTPLRIR